MAGLGGCGPQFRPVLDPTSRSHARFGESCGSVYGGQQPVTGSTIQLWQVGTTGFGSSGSSLIPTTVTTSDGTGLLNSNANAGNANNSLPAGQFTLNFTNAYSCPTPGTLVYMTSTGGNPGLTSGTNNSAIVMMTCPDECGNLGSSTFISLNEVVTTGTVENLSTFLGASSSVRLALGRHRQPAGHRQRLRRSGKHGQHLHRRGAQRLSQAQYSCQRDGALHQLRPPHLVELRLAVH